MRRRVRAHGVLEVLERLRGTRGLPGHPLGTSELDVWSLACMWAPVETLRGSAGWSLLPGLPYASGPGEDGILGPCCGWAVGAALFGALRTGPRCSCTAGGDGGREITAL